MPPWRWRGVICQCLLEELTYPDGTTKTAVSEPCQTHREGDE